MNICLGGRLSCQGQLALGQILARYLDLRAFLTGGSLALGLMLCGPHIQGVWEEVQYHFAEHGNFCRVALAEERFCRL